MLNDCHHRERHGWTAADGLRLPFPYWLDWEWAWKEVGSNRDKHQGERNRDSLGEETMVYETTRERERERVDPLSVTAATDLCGLTAVLCIQYIIGKMEEVIFRSS